MHTFTYGRLTCTHILGSHEHIYKDTGSHAHIYKDIVGSHTHKHTSQAHIYIYSHIVGTHISHAYIQTVDTHIIIYTNRQ